MNKLLYVYFSLHIQLIKSDSLYQQRNCSNELEPLLNLVSDQGKKVVWISEEDQISVEHITPHFDVEPCDLHQYRKNLDEQNHHHGRVSEKHLQITPFQIDPACGCNFVRTQEWHPDNRSMLVEQKQQRRIQDYEMIYLFWPRKSYYISHVDPSRHKIQVVDPYYFIDILMLFPNVLTSFFETYRWISWKIFYDDRSYPGQETDPCYILLLQPLRWCCVDCVIHHERDVCEEQKYMYVARTSNNRVISSGDLYCCLLPQCEALRTCHSRFPIATLLKDMPTIRSIEVNHNIGGDVNASALEECNFRKKVQILTLSNAEVQIRIPAGRIRDIRPDIQTKIIIMIACIFNGIGIHQADHIIG